MKRLLIAAGLVAATGAGAYVTFRGPASTSPPAAVKAQRATTRPPLRATARSLADLQEIARGEDPVARESALVSAAELGTTESVHWLADVASSSDRLAGRAAAALGAVHDRRAASALAEIASGTAPVIVRANAARALGASGGHEQAEVLARLVSGSDEQPRVRQEAALALAAIGGNDGVPALVATLDATDEQLRISAVQALGRIGSPAARQALTRHARGSLSKTERAFVDGALAP